MVTVNIHESYVKKVAIGQNARVSLDAEPGSDDPIGTVRAQVSNNTIEDTFGAALSVATDEQVVVNAHLVNNDLDVTTNGTEAIMEDEGRYLVDRCWVDLWRPGRGFGRGGEEA